MPAPNPLPAQRLLLRGLSAIVALGLSGAPLPALAQSTTVAYASNHPIAYPAQGQSQKQQDKDRGECSGWARTLSGFDPLQADGLSTSATPAPPGSVGTAASMAGGGMGGAAIAELSGHDVGQGAARGALGAGLIAKIREQKAVKAQQQAAQQQQNARSQLKSTYDRAMVACLEGRGYSVR